MPEPTEYTNMSGSNDNGVIRSKLFGGFDKKEVFQFIDEIKRDSNAKIEELKAENEKLKAAAKSQKSELQSKDETIKQLQSELDDINAKLSSLDIDGGSDGKTPEDSIDYFKTRLEKTLDECAKLRGDAENTKSEFNRLSEICEQMKASNLQLIDENRALLADAKTLDDKQKQLNAQLEAMDKKVLQYEQSNAGFINEISRLKAVGHELSKRLLDSEENAAYKRRYEEASQKVLSAQSEIAALKSLLDDEMNRRDTLESAIRELASIDFSVFDSACAQLGDIIDASQSVRTSVYTALEKCGETGDGSENKPNYSDVKHAANEQLISEMLSQIERANQIINNNKHENTNQ